MIYGDNLILSAKIYNENFFTSSNLLYDQLVFYETLVTCRKSVNYSCETREPQLLGTYFLVQEIKFYLMQHSCPLSLSATPLMQSFNEISIMLRKT